MYQIPGYFDLDEETSTRGPFHRIRKYGGAAGRFIANAGAAVLVLGIVVLMRFGGKETRY